MPTIGGIVVTTGTAASGRRTLLDIMDELARPVNADDATIRALAGDAFRAAVGKMNIKGNWPWEYQDEDIVLTANRPTSTATGAVKKPLAMHYLDESGGTRDEPLGYQPYDQFMERYSLDVSGSPYIYTIPNLFETGQVRWYPTPSAADNVRFTYYRATPAPRNEQEAVEIPEHALTPYMALAWYEFMKRLPSAQRPYPITVALSDAHMAFRDISVHVNSPGDRRRTF